jgi:hypothetical protein
VAAARKIEEHAAIIFEQIGRGGFAIGTAGSRVDNDIEPMRHQVVADGGRIGKIELGADRRPDIVSARECLGKVSSDEARSAGDENSKRQIKPLPEEAR